MKTNIKTEIGNMYLKVKKRNFLIYEFSVFVLGMCSFAYIDSIIVKTTETTALIIAIIIPHIICSCNTLFLC